MSLFTVAMGFADGCLIRILPIPPPTAERAAASTCAPPLCPDGGVVYTIEGSARSGALVIATNATRQHPDGRQYVASAWATVVPSTPDAGPSNAHFALTFSPESESDGSVTVTQLGDRIQLVQFVLQEDGTYRQSDSSELVVAP